MNSSNDYAFGFAPSTPSIMSILEQSSILNESINIIFSCLSFLGLVVLYIGAIAITYHVLLHISSISAMKWSDLRSNPSAFMTTALPEKDVLDVYYGLAVVDGIFLTVIMLYTAWGAGLGFLGSLWHGLGVGDKKMLR